MVTFTVRSRIGKDGFLNLHVPVGVQDTEVDVVLVLQPRSLGAPTAPSSTYPPNFIQETYGSLPDLEEVEPEGIFELREDLA